MKKGISPEECLKNAKTVAVVGISPNPERPSNYVTRRLIENMGGRIKVFLINPGYAGQNIHGIEVLPSLSSVPEKIDIVNVFRNKEQIEEVILEAIKCGAGCVWLQPGTENPPVIEKYKDKIPIIYNSCIGVVSGLLKK